MMKKKLQLTKAANIAHYGSSEIEIDLEDYVAISVSSEIGNAPLEACKAQAVAIRTNAIAREVLTDNSAVFQAFTASRLYSNPLAAAKATKGQILYHNGKPALPASFSSCNSGRTVSSKERWRGERAWLVSKPDPYNKVAKRKGHGVGLSQTGAIEMAKQGFDYKAILSFYYPNTTVEGGETMPSQDDKINKLIEWCKSKVGCGYVWGAKGEVLTQATLASLKAKFPKYINVEIVKKWYGRQVYDCANFVAQAFNQIGFRPHTGASSQWNLGNWEAKGEIATMPSDKVCIVFRTAPKANPMQHTGIYLGNGWVIDARGSNSGVLHTKLESYKWSHWGILKGLYPEGVGKTTTLPIKVEKEVIKVIYKARVMPKTGSTVRLRESHSISAGVLQAVPKGTVAEVLETAGTWSRIKVNGLTGWMMSEFLVRIEGSSASTTDSWRVVIECGSEGDARKTAEIFQAAKVEKATA